jgi:hypothetical protein
MITEQELRTALTRDIGQVAVPADLVGGALQRGKRMRMRRRIAVSATATVSVLGISFGAVHIAGGLRESDHVVVQPTHDGSSSAAWWETWAPNRQFGPPVSDGFLSRIRPQYDGETQPEHIRVWATATMPDSTNFVVYTDKQSPHTAQWISAYDEQPNFGEATDVRDNAWLWVAAPTASSHAHNGDMSEWLVIVGRPDTKEVDYAPDGRTWISLTTENGIGTIRLASGLPSADAKVRLSDQTGIYAQAPLRAPAQ